MDFIFIAGINRSGGSLLARLFDGHRDFASYPMEVGFKFDYSSYGFLDKITGTPTYIPDFEENLNPIMYFEAENETISYKWGKESISARTSSSSKLFGIIQGGNNLQLREISAKKMTQLDFDGFAYGGLSVGEDKDLMIQTQISANRLLPEDKPRYLMGIGSPEDLVRSIYNGFDMFDCVLPTRIARNGSLFTNNGRINIFNSKYKNLDKPIVLNCECYSCHNYSVAYIHHLFKAKELLGYRIASIHNLAFLYNLMNEIRQHIKNSDFSEFVNEFLSKYKVPNQKVQQEQKSKWIESKGRIKNNI